MSRKSGRFSADFKPQLIIKLLLEQETVAELCCKYEISSQTINDWKHEFLSNRTVKYEEVLLKSYSDIRETRGNIDEYINRDKKFRLHSSLRQGISDEVHFHGM